MLEIKLLICMARAFFYVFYYGTSNPLAIVVFYIFPLEEAKHTVQCKKKEVHCLERVNFGSSWSRGSWSPRVARAAFWIFPPLQDEKHNSCRSKVEKQKKKSKGSWAPMRKTTPNRGGQFIMHTRSLHASLINLIDQFSSTLGIHMLTFTVHTLTHTDRPPGTGKQPVRHSTPLNSIDKRKWTWACKKTKKNKMYVCLYVLSTHEKQINGEQKQKLKWRGA